MPTLLPFPRYFYPSTFESDRLPVTREGIRHLSPFPFTAFEGSSHPLLAIDQADGLHAEGICGLLPATDFTNGTVRPHEATLTARLSRQDRLVREDRGALGKPVLLTVPTLEPIRREFRIDGHLQTGYHEPTGSYHLICGNLDAPQGIALDTVGPLVIADGHHRAYTHAALAAAGHAAFDLIPVVLIGADELRIGTFMRVIDPVAPADLLPQLETYFIVRALPTALPVTQAGTWLLSVGGRHFDLTRKNDAVTVTDAGWLDAVVFPSVFGIEDTRRDPRIISVEPPPRENGAFVFPQEFHDHVKLIGHPLTRERFFTEVTAGRTLPPKSTRFTPRIPSGLLVWIP